MFESIINHFRRAREISLVKAELNALSDHELKDIGISRYDIDAIARSHARRRAPAPKRHVSFTPDFGILRTNLHAAR